MVYGLPSSEMTLLDEVLAGNEKCHFSSSPRSGWGGVG